MKILDIQVLRGPNIWSNYRQQLIVMKLDLQDLETRPTHRITGFAERLKTAMPSLHGHRCSEGHKGGFFQRVEQGTWMGHVIEHLALELQTLAGMPCGYGRTRSTGENGVYHVVIAYRVEEAGLYATQAAIRLAESLIAGETPDIRPEVKNLELIRQKRGDDPAMHLLLQEAQNREIPVKKLARSLYIFGHGVHQQKVRKNLKGHCSGLGISITRDLEETRSLLRAAYIPVPDFMQISCAEDLKQAFESLRFPLTLKKQDRNGVRLIVAGLSDPSAVETEYNKVSRDQQDLFLEEDIEGETYFLMIANHKLAAVLRQTENASGNGGSSCLSHTDGLEIPCFEDAGGDVHPVNKQIAERASRLLDLNLCCMRVVCRDIATPLNSANGFITDIQAGPSLDRFTRAAGSSPVNLAKPVLSTLFPEGKFRIPVIALSAGPASSGRALCISQMLSSAARKSSLALREGVIINGRQITTKSGCRYAQASAVLFDPCTETAILECDTAEILSSGLPFDHCDVAVIAGPAYKDEQGDHVRALQALLHTVGDKGYALLDSDDDLVYALRGEAYSSYALFSEGRKPDRIDKHCRNGGLAAIAENGNLLIREGKWTIQLTRPEDARLLELPDSAPLLRILLPAVLTAHLSGLSSFCIRKAVQKFINETSHETAGGKIIARAAYYRKAS